MGTFARHAFVLKFRHLGLATVVPNDAGTDYASVLRELGLSDHDIESLVREQVLSKR